MKKLHGNKARIAPDKDIVPENTLFPTATPMNLRAEKGEPEAAEEQVGMVRKFGEENKK